MVKELSEMPFNLMVLGYMVALKKENIDEISATFLEEPLKVYFDNEKIVIYGAERNSDFFSQSEYFSLTPLLFTYRTDNPDKRIVRIGVHVDYWPYDSDNKSDDEEDTRSDDSGFRGSYSYSGPSNRVPPEWKKRRHHRSRRIRAR
ncbi:MAG: hypothetical protein IJQ02_01030 [Oscillospiraceae bacterium]|nr:hypothetical protein [Oscillospiraceae bacterium]